jgi:beta-galactosidase
MGLMVLAETSVFGSSIRLNPEQPVFWERYAAHYDGMVQRDRNHPSVMGWSFGNEMFAIPRLNEMSKEDTQAYYDKLIAMSRRSSALDPTRTWITCDGDEDLQGSLPVWSKHFGHGNFDDKLPKGLNKPMVVGESGGTYYATPEQLSVFNGDRAYENYLGRNEALAVDLYDNIVKMALPYLAHFSPSLMVWYGLEHLNFGYHDFSRLPTEQDGVFFSGPFVEGKPGMQPERIPPYVTTVNPGWDPALPLYKPLPMFHAMKAAIAPGGPQPCPWDHKSKVVASPPAPVPATVDQVAFAGADKSPLRERLVGWGVPLVTNDTQKASVLIVDGQTLSRDQVPAVRARLDSVLAAGGIVLLMVRDAKAPIEVVNALIPAPLSLTDRKATQLQPNGVEAWAGGLGQKDLYFANLEGQRHVLKCGLAGPLVEKGTVVLEAGKTDWSLFNNNPEKTKAAAVVLYEQLQKPSGVALVRVKQGAGTLAVSSLDYRITAPVSQAMWRRLFGNMGIKLLEAKGNGMKGAGKGRKHDLLLNGPME